MLPMLSPRTGASATTLIDGRVLVAGGNNGTDDLKSLKSSSRRHRFRSNYDALSFERSGHAAVLLPNNNSVLIAGGSSNKVPVQTSDLFVPAEFPIRIRTAWAASRRRRSAHRACARGRVAAYRGIRGDDGRRRPNAEVYRFPTIKTDKDDTPGNAGNHHGFRMGAGFRSYTCVPGRTGGAR
jgi:hypothetical protein